MAAVNVPFVVVVRRVAYMIPGSIVLLIVSNTMSKLPLLVAMRATKEAARSPEKWRRPLLKIELPAIVPPLIGGLTCPQRIAATTCEVFLLAILSGNDIQPCGITGVQL